MNKMEETGRETLGGLGPLYGGQTRQQKKFISNTVTRFQKQFVLIVTNR